MHARPGRPRRISGTLAIAALMLAGCAGTDEPASTGSPTETSSASETATATPTTSASPARPTASGNRIDVAFAAGQVSGDTGRVPVPVGEEVTITVTSDVADEIHLHGYDLSAEVSPEAPATLTFPATIPGVFEVELEQLGTLLFTLQVG